MWVIVLLIALLGAALAYGVTGGPLAALLGAVAGAVVATIARPRDVRLEARMRTLENAIEARRTPPATYDAPSVSTAPYTSADAETLPADSAGSTPAAAPSAWSRFWVWLVEGNALARVGAVVLFVGVGFLLKYLYWLASASTGLRFAVVVLATIALLWVGWHLRNARPRYAQALQACALGLLYIAAFAASNLLSLLPGWTTLVWLIAVVALAAILAMAQNAQWLAMVAVAGGFLAPVLALPGGAHHVALFAYTLLLDLAILAIALRKSWHALNVLGLVLTFGLGSVWGAQFYSNAYFGSTEPFLILFFLLYLAVAVFRAWREPAPSDSDHVDTAIVFGAPLMAFLLQTELFRGVEPVVAHRAGALSALAVAALYFLLALAFVRRGNPGLRKLARIFEPLGAIFAAVAIPLWLDGSWIPCAWALAGAALYWTGTRQGRALPRVFGVLLQVAAGAGLVADLQRGAIELPVLNGVFLSCVALAAAALFCSRVDARLGQTSGHSFARAEPGLFFWGLAWWVTGGLHEIAVHAPDRDVLGASLLFLTATCAAFSYASGRGWSLARFPAAALLPIMAVVLVLQAFEHTGGHPLARLGVVAWPVAFLIHFGMLRRDQDTGARFRLVRSAGFWLLAAATTWELAWAIGQLFPGPYTHPYHEPAPAGLLAKVAWAFRDLDSHPYWPYAAWALAPVALLAIVAGARRAWPVARAPAAYLWTGCKPLVFFLILWTVAVNLLADQDPFPDPYVPLLNPLDIVQMLAFAVVVLWWRALCASGIQERHEFPSTWPVTAWCVAIFYWANAVLFRTVHQIGDGGYRFAAALQSDQVQMAISLLWVSLALGTMLVGRWVRNRQMWIVGSVLMVTVVVKLIAVELQRSISVESVISGIAVGIVMLAAGWLVPVPPKYVAEE